MDLLKVPGPQAGPDEVREAVIVNAQLLQSGVDKLGVNLLKNVNSRVAQSTTSTSYVKLTDFQMAAKTSGGLVAIFANLFVEIDTSYIQLLVDDQEVKVCSGGGANAMRPIIAFVSLAAGNHTFKLMFKAAGGTAVVGNSAIDSSMYVTEFLKG